MATEYASRGLVGVLVPQANTTVEPELSILLPPGYASLGARLTSDAPSLESRLVEYFDHYGETAARFANAPLSALALACTGSSYLAGRDREADMLATLSRRFEVPAITAGTAVIDALRELSARRIALVSPYPAGLTGHSIRYWESHGLTVATVVPVTVDETAFHSIYATSAEAACAAVDGLYQRNEPVDAVILLGTGLPTLGAILSRAGRPGPPLLSCMLGLAWRSVKAIRPEDGDLAVWLSGRDWQDAYRYRSREPRAG